MTFSFLKQLIQQNLARLKNLWPTSRTNCRECTLCRCSDCGPHDFRTVCFHWGLCEWQPWRRSEQFSQLDVDCGVWSLDSWGWNSRSRPLELLLSSVLCVRRKGNIQGRRCTCPLLYPLEKHFARFPVTLGFKCSRGWEIHFQWQCGLWFASRFYAINCPITLESSQLLTLMLVIFNYAFWVWLSFSLVLTQCFKMSIIILALQMKEPGPR